jgi:hypothetical protein
MVGSVPQIDNDVKVEFYHSTTFGKVHGCPRAPSAGSCSPRGPRAQAKLFQCWFNTRFLQPTAEVHRLR